MPVREQRHILANAGRPGHTPDIACYLENGGYKALRKALARKPETVVAAVRESGLRGRGGAGFPVGVKWGFLDRKSGKPVYLIVNADESEPGTFKDRQLLYRDPHQVLEGALITAHAIGAARVFIYIRGEFQHGARILENAIAEARAQGLCGEAAVAGEGVPVEVIVHRGGGCYVCGEETGQIESLEGRRGCPRIKPPFFPAARGFLDCPTIVNNVETMAQVRRVIAIGGAAFAQIGAPGDPGTHLWGVSGHVRRPGVYELNSGAATIGELLHDLCGGPLPGRRFKALIPGGSSTKILRFGERFSGTRPDGTPYDWRVEDIPLDAVSLALCRTSIGTGGMIVMDDSTDMLAALANLCAFYAHESCGQCTPCREGSLLLERLAHKLAKHGGVEADVARLKTVADQIAGRSICAHGEAVAWPVQSGVEKFYSEYVATAATTLARQAPAPV